MAAGFIADHSIDTHGRDGLHDHHADDHQVPECEGASQSRCAGGTSFTAQKISPLCGTERQSLWLVALKRREQPCGNFTLLNRFNASNSARSSQTAQAQSFAARAIKPNPSVVLIWC